MLPECNSDGIDLLKQLISTLGHFASASSMSWYWVCSVTVLVTSAVLISVEPLDSPPFTGLMTMCYDCQEFWWSVLTWAAISDLISSFCFSIKLAWACCFNIFFSFLLWDVDFTGTSAYPKTIADKICTGSDLRFFMHVPNMSMHSALKFILEAEVFRTFLAIAAKYVLCNQYVNWCFKALSTSLLYLGLTVRPFCFIFGAHWKTDL